MKRKLTGVAGKTELEQAAEGRSGTGEPTYPVAKSITPEEMEEAAKRVLSYKGYTPATAENLDAFFKEWVDKAGIERPSKTKEGRMTLDDINFEDFQKKVEKKFGPYINEDALRDAFRTQFMRYIETAPGAVYDRILRATGLDRKYGSNIPNPLDVSAATVKAQQAKPVARKPKEEATPALPGAYVEPTLPKVDPALSNLDEFIKERDAKIKELTAQAAALEERPRARPWRRNRLDGR